MLKILLFNVLSLAPTFKNKWSDTTCLMLIGSAMTMLVWVNKNTLSSVMLQMGVDTVSMVLILMSFWITGLMITASTSVNRFNFKPKWFTFTVIMLMLFLNLTFSSTNILIFYISFEATLIPTLMLILGWGYQPERTQAGLYMLFYTLTASLPLLLMIFYIKSATGSVSMLFLNNMNLNVSLLGYVATILAFLVKMPMFMVHLWLPKAHVEAPVSGSMILAGVLLKLGGYGLIRMGPIFYNKFINLNIMWVVISLTGGAATSFICLRQTDTKSLVAYSSVAHMSLVIGGIMTGSVTGGIGSLILMVAHGLCSSGMFCLTNILYERLSSRNMIVCKGLMIAMPSMTLWWFLISSCNMAAPPSINLLGEIVLINSVSAWSLVNVWSLGVMSFMSAAFTLYLFAFTQHGRPFNGLFSFSSGNLNEFITIALHWIPLNLFILKSELFMF